MSYRTGRPTSAIRTIVGAIISATAGAVFFVVSAAPAPAAAHTALKASSPKDGGKIDAAPSELVLEFTQPVLATGARIVVQGPDGQYQGGQPRIVDKRVILPLKPLGPAGDYRVTFRIVAYDGHPLTNGMRFTLTKPGPAAGGSQTVAQPAPLTPLDPWANSSSPNNAPPWAPWFGGTIAVILMSGAVVFGRRVTRGLD